jgi:putative protease
MADESSSFDPVTLKQAVSHANRKPEVMSPAGYWPQLEAAIHAGADSVYFGLKHFTARAKTGFELTELPDVMRTLHRAGVRGFVTFNTLVFDHEWSEAARALTKIADAGADAVIIQDLGILDLAHRMLPGLELHASTQMSITDAAGVALAAKLGAARVTLARELSLEEVRRIRDASPVELEIFVHGALCVAYSGQCLSSEAWGGRSANRGQCAQACRLPYEMYVDGEHRPLGDARYLLSPGDLSTLEMVPGIVEAGVSALKIEGRYKEADYVALVTRAYREAVDAAWGKRPLTVDPAAALRLEQVYSRGLGPYFLSGTNHQAVVRGRAPRHRGVEMGRVVKILGAVIEIDASDAHEILPLKPGDGVVFDAASWRSPQEAEEGGRVYRVSPAGGRLRLEFGNGAIDPSRIRVGDIVWRTDDPALEREVRKILASPRRRPVDIEVTAKQGQPLFSRWRLGDAAIEVSSAGPLEEARGRVLDEITLREQFGRLGDSPFELRSLGLMVEGRPFLPVSALNDLRRRAVAALVERVEQAPPMTASVVEPPAAVASERRSPRLHLLVRSAQQLDAAIALRPASITLDYLDLYGLRPSVERVKEAAIEVRVASPRILKPGEEKISDFLIRLDCALLVRPAGLLDVLRGRTTHPLSGDFSLNAANPATAHLLLSMGLDRLTPAHDLNAQQIVELAGAVGGHRLEVVAYQHLPVFHTEHCVFCRFLSSGTSYLDCGRPCESHLVTLNDSVGRAHPVIADVGCRNTVFGAEAQVGVRFLDQWRAAGIADYRLEFVHEPASQVLAIGEAFRETLAGRASTAMLRDRLLRAAPAGLTEGSLHVAPGYRELPVLS